ncbi:MAG TPA: short-chain fatty acyl-CoA regulator family protein [Polyangiaceae bacterium]|nr:short-chain fatty acyl-CoA regulator family protein [Polyangiaceae bacterium]
MPESTQVIRNATVGHRLRQLRLDRGHPQADFAKRLGISPSYLNLIEKGKRAVQLPLLWRALELLQVKPEPFLEGLGKQPVEQNLAQLLDEPLLRTLNLDRVDLATISAEPTAVTTVTTLFNLYKNTRIELDKLQELVSRREAGEKARASIERHEGTPVSDTTLQLDYSPLDEVVDFLQAHKNFFPEIEEASQESRRDFGLERRVLSDTLQRVLEEQLDIEVIALPPGKGSSVVRHYDRAEGKLALASGLSEARRKFDLAHVVGLRRIDELGLDRSIMRSLVARHPETPRLIKIHLANYFAGALLTPYEDMFREAQRTRYDVEGLAGLFEMNYEAVAHRLTNLADPKRRGVPMHFLRVDLGGNISKRYSATGLTFPVGLGSCPKWVVHTAFLTPSTISRQFSLMPNGGGYFCFAKVSASPVHGSLVKGTVYSIGLGTHAEDAHHLAYADDLPRWSQEQASRISVPVGITCRFCERTDCSQRAAPSYKFAFSPDEYVKKDNFFSPILDSDVRSARSARGGSEPPEPRHVHGDGKRRLKTV